MGPILVAGASGALGQRVVARLLDGGHPVRVIARDPRRLGIWADRVEVHQGDVLTDARLADAFTGVRAVFSSLGASVQPTLGQGRRSYDRVDVPANLRLIEAARAARVARFVYVSLLQTPAAGLTAYVRAHERVVDVLRGSDLDWCVLRPTGFHSVFVSMLDLASNGRVPYFGDGAALSNPIADEDLAAVAVEQLAAPSLAERELALGGPDVLSRKQVSALACEIAGRGRTLSLPPIVGKTMALLVRPISPRMSDLMRFALAIGGEDAIAPVAGKITLRETFAREMARRSGGRSLAA